MRISSSIISALKVVGVVSERSKCAGDTKNREASAGTCQEQRCARNKGPGTKVSGNSLVHGGMEW